MTTPLESKDDRRGYNTNSPADQLQENQDEDAIIVISEPLPSQIFSWRKLLLHAGPGFLMCIAYIDPGNLEADLQTGVRSGYALLWLLLLSTAMGYLLQSLSAKLGVGTGKHLAEHCRDCYSKPLRFILWFMAELAIVGADIQEVCGVAIAASLLSDGQIPLWVGVVGAAVVAYIFLFLDKLGVRYLELFFQLLVALMATTMFLLFFWADIPVAEVIRGFSIPQLDAKALPTAAALIGSILMPHNLFLHSALVANRALPAAYRATMSLDESLKYYNIEAALALLITLGINTSVISVFSRGFYGRKRTKSDIGLENAGSYLGARFGRQMKLIWGVGLLAAGQSSTMTGTYAGQYVMSGYLNLKVKPALRSLITRAVAVGPTLLVALYARSDSTRLDAFNQWINILQSVQLPFAVLPLLAFTSDHRIMGQRFVNSRSLSMVAWIIAAGIMFVNCGTAYQLLDQFVEKSRFFHVVLAGFGCLYVGLILYLLFETYAYKGNRFFGASHDRGDEDRSEEEDARILAEPLLNSSLGVMYGQRGTMPPTPPASISGESSAMSTKKNQLDSHEINPTPSE